MPRRPWSALLAGLLFTFAASPVLADPPVPKAASSVLNRIKAADTNLLAVSEEDGRFLRFLVVSSGAKNVLEIGGANGYSAIWIGLGLRETGGRLVTIEYDAARAKDAEANIKAAGLSDVVQVIVAIVSSTSVTSTSLITGPAQSTCAVSVVTTGTPSQSAS